MYVFFLDPDDQSGAEIETVYILFFICLIDAFSQQVTFCNCTSQGFKTSTHDIDISLVMMSEEYGTYLSGYCA